MPRVNLNSRPRMNATFSVTTTNLLFDPSDLSSLINSNPDGLFQILVPLLPQNMYNLTLSLEDLLLPKLSQNGKIPRPQNAWMLFRKDFTAKIKPENNKKLRVEDISRMASDSWKNPNVKQYFDILAICAKQIHLLTYPNYKFRPTRKNEAAPRADPQVPQVVSEDTWENFVVYNSPQFTDSSSLEDVPSLDEFYELTVSELNNCT